MKGGWVRGRGGGREGGGEGERAWMVMHPPTSTVDADFPVLQKTTTCSAGECGETAD